MLCYRLTQTTSRKDYKDANHFLSCPFPVIVMNTCLLLSCPQLMEILVFWILIHR
ncbi:hypothetical protein SLEP1_g55109 [Rubroshorea leprosula]|uniref:Uncharacterized protein n=1 Tax=Rubroshorea leprosula TaxID=152421 RepID=A0AAV5MFI0_9ROSI|nr:hypothetical protein SLEP1_g55109 [Rubroshorea leprosula]